MGRGKYRSHQPGSIHQSQLVTRIQADCNDFFGFDKRFMRSPMLQLGRILQNDMSPGSCESLALAETSGHFKTVSSTNGRSRASSKCGFAVEQPSLQPGV